jgi:branched-chain amino acid transport system permease protein
MEISGSLIADQLVMGLAYGMILALVALGLSLIFGLMEVINFAHGAFYALGAYLAFAALGFVGNFWVALVIGAILVGVVGGVVERLLVRRVYVEPVRSLLLMFGVMLAILQAIRFIWGVAYQPFSYPSELLFTIDVGPVSVSAYRVFIIIISAAVSYALWLFLKKTNVGLIIRAGIQDRDMVRILGIDISKIFTLVFAVGIAIGGIAGVLAAPMMGLYPEVGLEILVISFVVVIVGGMGSIRGSIIAGIIIGEATSLCTLVYPEGSYVIPYIVMGAFLLVRPTGLMGGKL